MVRCVAIGRNWELGIYWQENWKFLGLIESDGFGKYLGITFPNKYIKNKW